MRPLFGGIKRKEHYSPNHSKNDSLVLQKTANELEKLGADYTLYSEDEILTSSIEANLFFSMARGAATINKLAEFERNGAIVVNSTQSVLNVHRVNMIRELYKKQIPLPKSTIVKTNSNIQLKISSIGKNKVWIKRGDVHAIHREDVSLVYSDEELNFVLNEFSLRGVRSAIIQEHMEGDVVKFYSVKDTNFFYWYYVERQNKYKFNLSHLKYLANKSSEVLDILIYGGDAIIGKDGVITIIDVNDWPSFAPVRDEASKYIAQAIFLKAIEFSSSEKISQLA